MEEELTAIERREKIRKNYDRISSIYDILEGSFEKRHRERALSFLEPGEGEIVLEVGFGTGDMLIDIYRFVGDGGEVYGVDISAGMIEETREKLRRSGLSDNVTIIAGDAVNLPFVSGYFDAVFMSFTIELFSADDIQKVLSEIYRALVKGGRLGVISLSNRRTSIVRDLYELAHERFPTLIDCRPIALVELLEENGFRVEKEKVETILGLPVETAVGVK